MFCPPPPCNLKGFRTLEDIRAKATLTSQQKIGMKHYDDFLDRMSRDEAAAIEKTVTPLSAQPFATGLCLCPFKWT